MNYTESAIEFLSSIQMLGKEKKMKSIVSNMKGEMFALLILLLAEAPVSPGELGSAMEISSARVAAVLNALERKGQVIREIDPADRRKIVVRLTDKGEETATACRDCSIQRVALLMERLGEQDAENLIRITKKMAEFVADMPIPY